MHFLDLTFGGQGSMHFARAMRGKRVRAREERACCTCFTRVDIFRSVTGVFLA